MVAGEITGGVAIAGSLVSGGAEVDEAIEVPPLFTKAQEKFDAECDKYKMAVLNLGRLHKVISEKHLPAPSRLRDTAEIEAADIDTLVASVLTVYARLAERVTEVSAKAAAGVAEDCNRSHRTWSRDQF